MEILSNEMRSDLRGELESSLILQIFLDKFLTVLAGSIVCEYLHKVESLTVSSLIHN
jgi:hypothetical protein